MHVVWKLQPQVYLNPWGVPTVSVYPRYRARKAKRRFEVRLEKNKITSWLSSTGLYLTPCGCKAHLWQSRQVRLRQKSKAKYKTPAPPPLSVIAAIELLFQSHTCCKTKRARIKARGGGRGGGHTRGACGSPDSVFSLCTVSCSESVRNPEFDCCHLSHRLSASVTSAFRIIRAAHSQAIYRCDWTGCFQGARSCH